MTLKDIDGTLPNGFHDAEIAEIRFDYPNRLLRFDMDVWVGSMMDPPETREAYRKAVLTISGVCFYSIELPDTDFFADYAERLSVDLARDDKPRVPERLLKTVPSGSFVESFFVNDWNCFLHLCASSAELAWMSEIEYR